jgi:hypothetical protein
MRKLKTSIIVLLLLAVAAFAFSPYKLGALTDYRAMVYLKYWGVIEPTQVNPTTLAGDLLSKDVRVQTEAAQAIGFLEPDRITMAALRQFIDRPDVVPSVKDVAIWSLGELRVKEALPQLNTRIGNAAYDQENLRKAIDKIEGKIEKSLLPE